MGSYINGKKIYDIEQVSSEEIHISMWGLSLTHSSNLDSYC